MRNKNAVSKSYLSDSQRFAQICNNQLFGSRRVIEPERLRELDTGELAIIGDRAPALEVLEKYRDVLRIYDDQVMFLILGIENQEEVHYAMPLRQMLYDVLKYENQRVRLQREHQEKKDLQGAEYMSGMAKTDRLMPVITLTVYWGKEAWDGAKSLYEMLDIPPVLSQYKDIINDYRMNLLEVRSMENLEAYSGELKALFGFVRYQKDKTLLKQFVSENKDIFQSLTPETIRAISVLGNVRELEHYLENRKEDEEVYDMCEALQEMIMDGKMEGRAEGKAEGKAEGVLEFLAELGDIPEKLRAEIMAQKDLDILKKWLKLAARAESVEDFVSRMHTS